MKRITLLTAILMVFVVSSNLQAQQILSQSNSQTVTDGAVACVTNDGATPPTSIHTSQNSFWRAYLLSDYGITGSFDIGGVQFGVGEISAPADITVYIYLNVGGPFPAGTRTELASIVFNVVPADLNTLVYADLPAPINVPASSEIVVEVNAPALASTTGDPLDGEFFRIGMNDQGETAPSYLTSVDCTITTPTDTEDIGAFPGNFLLNLAEEGALAIDKQALSQISIYPNPMQDVLNISLPSSVQLESAAMFNLLGEKIEMPISENNTLNTSNLASGVYILKLQTSQGNLTKKVIKQ